MVLEIEALKVPFWESKKALVLSMNRKFEAVKFGLTEWVEMAAEKAKYGSKTEHEILHLRPMLLTRIRQASEIQTSRILTAVQPHAKRNSQLTSIHHESDFSSTKIT